MKSAYIVIFLITMLVAASESSGKDIVLAIRQNGKDFEDVLKGLSE